DQEYEKRGQTSHWHTYGPAWMVKDKAYSQAHLPLAQQQTAIGHAVRFAYLMTGVAHLARLSHDDSKRQDCLRLWNNMAQRQLYITGGIGSQSSGEAFSSDYDLPNDTVYAESCASIGLMMFARRMLEMEGDSQYADVMERALYNTVLGGMALDGKHFFYVNPLE
ncbi:glycoside hydrolase family 127 protein, partial [Escherichia coli]|nr:glycoside hydrolase family 127 protein [Escherichia coli]